MSPHRQHRQCRAEGSPPHQTQALCSMSGTGQPSCLRHHCCGKRHAEHLLSEGPVSAETPSGYAIEARVQMAWLCLQGGDQHKKLLGDSESGLHR